MSQVERSGQSIYEPLRERFAEWARDPALFVRDVIGAEPVPWQEKALRALVTHDRLSIRSGHGVGKSAFLSWVIIWWHTMHYPAKTGCTAPTAKQLNDVLWSELAKWHRQMKDPIRSWFEVRSDVLVLKSAPKESFAVARTARKEEPEAFQGLHSDNMLIIADEASGIDDIIFEVSQGAMSTPGAKTILTGNPTRTSGYFFDTHHKLRDKWWTLRVASGESKATYESNAYAQEIADAYGPDSNIFRVRVLGEFPQSEDDVVVPLHLVENAQNRDVKPGPGSVIWGLDVARFGDDRSALAKRRGNALLDKTQFWRGKDLMQLSNLIAAEYEMTPEPDKPHRICVDAIGYGAGVADRLKEMGYPALAVNVAEQAAAKKNYMRQRDELWFKAREWFMGLDCTMPADDELAAELTGVKYALTQGGKIQVESKDDMKRRGLRSPDLADAFCMTFAATDRIHSQRFWGRELPMPPVAVA
jgi:predicted fused transcriptional regulator/phosphomethylpyrimidine kinase